MKAAETAREKTEFNQLRQDALNFAKGGYCDVARQTLTVMDSIAARHPELRPEWQASETELKKECGGIDSEEVSSAAERSRRHLEATVN